MDLKINQQRFIVCGASSGFGEAIADQLLAEGAKVVLVARRGDVLEEKFNKYGDKAEIIEGDVTLPETLQAIENAAKKDAFHGIILNAGGPPVGTPLQTKIGDWDEAWQLVMRWKIELTQRLAPILVEKGYGRILFIESQSVKQPMPNLALSNVFRVGMVGFAKSLALEIASKGVTVNVLAPGSHDTPAIGRVLNHNSKTKGITIEDARKELEMKIPVGRFGKPEEIASFALWLLSPHSSYVTGQTISHDGGVISGIFG
jgi:3-oxoacyl-[acyl-carrier protein] reductase